MIKVKHLNCFYTKIPLQSRDIHRGCWLNFGNIELAIYTSESFDPLAQGSLLKPLFRHIRPSSLLPRQMREMRPWKEFCDVDIKTGELFEDAFLRFTSQFGCRCCVWLYYYYEVQGHPCPHSWTKASLSSSHRIYLVRRSFHRVNVNKIEENIISFGGFLRCKTKV